MKVMQRIHNCFFFLLHDYDCYKFRLVKFYAFAILYVLIVMQIKLVVVVVVIGVNV